MLILRPTQGFDAGVRQQGLVGGWLADIKGSILDLEQGRGNIT